MSIAQLTFITNKETKMIRLNSGKKIRAANRHFFEESGIRNCREQKQHPYLIFSPTKTRMNVDICYTADELLELPDNTKVMAQWKGKKRSDFYRFTVRELKRHIAGNPRQARQRI